MFFRLLVLFVGIVTIITGHEKWEDYENQDESNPQSKDSDYQMAKNSIRGYGGKGDFSKIKTFSTRPKASYPGVRKQTAATESLQLISKKWSAYRGAFNDPLWPNQWYAQDYRTTDGPVMDLNLVPVYKMGITGKGIRVAVVDNGVKSDHPDLIANYDMALRYDTIENVTGSRPETEYDVTAKTWINIGWHGTLCAGVIAMTANNGICGVGVAYNAKIVDVRGIGQKETPYSKSAALTHKLDLVDIYSSSWGPADDGATMIHMNKIIHDALYKGTSEGRGGKGAIYVFPGGNGRRVQDNCAADAYVNHPLVMAVGAASQLGKVAASSEACTAIVATTYSGVKTKSKDGVETGEQVVSTDVTGGCVTDFPDTSAATPIAAGMIALALEANPKMTYRDVIHLISMTAEVAPLASNEGTWYRNGAGFWVSNDFGFGLLNAENMVLQAQRWTNVPKKNICKVALRFTDDPKILVVDEPVRVSLPTEACSGGDGEVNFLESIVLQSTVTHGYRGALQINITSPAKTVSRLLRSRHRDTDDFGLEDWGIKSFHNWGEDPKGEWIIDFELDYPEGYLEKTKNVQQDNQDDMKCEDPRVGCVYGLILYLHGTAEPPAHRRLMPRTYAAFTLPDGQSNLTPKSIN